MQSPDFAQQGGGGANIDIRPNPDGTFTGTLPIPGFPPVTAATEQEVLQQLAAMMQQLVGKGGMQPNAGQGPAGPMPMSGPPRGQGPLPAPMGGGMPPGM